MLSAEKAGHVFPLNILKLNLLHDKRYKIYILINIYSISIVPYQDFTCINNMNIDMLRIAGRWVTLVLATILRSHMTDDEAGGGEVTPVRDHHCSTPLPVIGDDLPIVVPEHE